MLFSEAKRHPVMSTDSATTIGRLDRFVVDPATMSVIALQLKKTEGDGDTLHWGDQLAFGPDAITVEGPDVIVSAHGRAAELIARDCELLNKRVLTDGGTEIGKIKDIDFDPDTGHVQLLVTDRGDLPGERLVGCGSYAVVVSVGTTETKGET